jgi:hypothetical protein
VAARTDTDTGRTFSGADSVLPSIAEWEKTQNGFVQSPLTQNWRSSHEAHFHHSGSSVDARSERRRAYYSALADPRLFDSTSRRAEP